MSFRHSVPTLVHVTPLVWLLACSEARELVPDGADLAEVPVVASVEWAVGAADGDPDYVFGSVSRGLALDGAGRLYVPDGLSNQIRVYGSDGTFVRAFGRPGDGPPFRPRRGGSRRERGGRRRPRGSPVVRREVLLGQWRLSGRAGRPCSTTGCRTSSSSWTPYPA